MGISVSEKHGVNPSMGVCTNCGKETGELLLLGKCNEYKCPACGKTIYGRLGPRRVCSECGSFKIVLVAQDVDAPMRIPMGICDKCKKKAKEHKALVRQGGVFWKCERCGSEGVVRPGTYLALAVRHKMGIVAPRSCGVEFTEEQCPVCSGKGGFG